MQQPPAGTTALSLGIKTGLHNVSTERLFVTFDILTAADDVNQL